MAQIRPAGFSDSESDSDFDDFCGDYYKKPVVRHYETTATDGWKKIEVSIQDAIINENIGEVEKIIKIDLNGNVNTKLESGWTPLMHACFHAQDRIVEYLLNCNANPNLHADSTTPLMTSCSNSSADSSTIVAIVKLLIQHGSNINMGDKYGQTPLMRAISSGRVAVVEELLNNKTNIEMRDQQGWTAIFWAVHHNQPEILNILIDSGARLTEIDKYDRSILEIAESHEYENILEILTKHMKIDNEEDENMNILSNTKVLPWHYFYPGVKKDLKPNYSNEIPHLLYGMNCERLCGLFANIDMNLRTFLLLKNSDLNTLGISLPFEKQRLQSGLKMFHLQPWKLKSVAGLYARKQQSYSMLDCLNTLGTHLQQVYILEATLQYACREYKKLHNKFKFEAPDSPAMTKLREEISKIKKNIRLIKKELKYFKVIFSKMSKKHGPPADFIKPQSSQRSTTDVIFKMAAVLSIGLLVYHSRDVLSKMINK